MPTSPSPPFFAALARLLPLALLHAPAGAQDFTVERVAHGLELPIHAGSPPGDPRIFVLEQYTGQVRIALGGELLAEPFLDVGTEINAWFEGGLLSLAFHPDFASSGRFFVSLVDLADDLVVREYRTSDDPDLADPAPVAELLRVPQTHPIHNGGHLEIGPDGKLYVALGDGGPGNDPGNNGQDPGTVQGSIVRLDPDLPAPYVPADNPFVGVTGAAEAVWVYGLRNPWIFDFDTLTGDLWIADVGQTLREEVDFLPAGGGAGTNFGWRCLEGLACFDAACCASPDLAPPLFEYTHASGRCAVIGGVAYRGPRMPWLHGAYLMGDYCSRELWVLRQAGGLLQEALVLPPPTYGGFPAAQKLRAFGVDGQGEVLMVDGGTGPGTGEVFRLVPKAGVQRYCAAGTNSGGGAARLDTQGPTSLSANAFALSVADAVPGENGLFFYGPAPQDVPFGDGRLCVLGSGGGIVRIPRVVGLDPAGATLLELDLAAEPFVGEPGQLSPGSTWYFQFWYRDPLSGGSGENLSDALAVTFAP